MRMRVFTHEGNRLSGSFPEKVLPGLSPQSYHRNNFSVKKLMMRMSFSFVFLTGVFQLCFAAAGPVKGKVTDDKGDALFGVSVQVKGSTVTVNTNNDGNYSINVPDGSTALVFTHVGFLSQEIEINGRSTIDVALLPDAKTLTDVVVVGYGKQKQVNL